MEYRMRGWMRRQFLRWGLRRHRLCGSAWRDACDQHRRGAVSDRPTCRRTVLRRGKGQEEETTCCQSRRWISCKSLSEARKLIGDREDGGPLADEGGDVRVGWIHDGGRGRGRGIWTGRSRRRRRGRVALGPHDHLRFRRFQAPHRIGHTWFVSGRCRIAQTA